MEAKGHAWEGQNNRRKRRKRRNKKEGAGGKKYVVMKRLLNLDVTEKELNLPR